MRARKLAADGWARARKHAHRERTNFRVALTDGASLRATQLVIALRQGPTATILRHVPSVAADSAVEMACVFPPACVLPVAPQPAHLRQVQHYYEEMVVATMSTLANRWDPSYPFVDTKLDLGSSAGENFQPDDPVRGRDAVYG
eukprot:COSAG02_NODE_26207_length_638_cov_1.044527_2_plen_143_part_01